ncbi:MAG: RNA polymerase sigma factor [Caulobacteraceae bacterium]|nr:RNA polymerase sigma factor [Caulobacteraceae bacterium]
MRLDGLDGGIEPIDEEDRVERSRPMADAMPEPGHGLDALFRDQAPRLMKLLARNTFGRDDALDIIQEGFLRMVCAVKRQALPLNPEAYLQSIVRNLMRDHARKAAVRRSGQHRLLDPEVLGGRSDDPEAVLQARDLLRRYEAALARLSPKTRDVFLRHRVGGFSYAEIAEQLNQSVSNIEKHMMKAIAHLDRMLGDDA